MKFRCERDLLAQALATATRAVSSRGGQLPVLSGLRVVLSDDELTLTGSDLDLTIEAHLQVAGEGAGQAVIPAKLLSDVVRALEPGAVTVEVSEGDAEITGGRTQFSIRTIAAEEFPQLPEPSGEGHQLDAAHLATALRQVVPAASGDDSRPILTGVLFAAEAGGLRLVATDSYRLALRDLPGTTILGDDQSVLVPSRALSELGRMLGDAEDLTLRLGERDATFEFAGSRLTTRLIEGDFPNYRGLIPESHPNRMVTDRHALHDAVRRVRLLAQESTPVRMTMTQGAVELVAITQDVGQAHETIDANYEGEDLTVAFNAQYLLDGIEVTDGDEVELETVDALKPALLHRVGDENFVYLLMPVRVP
ncbi:MAG: DNA polymerase III subunit beta [Acidimicrobiales bacterium]